MCDIKGKEKGINWQLANNCQFILTRTPEASLGNYLRTGDQGNKREMYTIGQDCPHGA